MKDWSGNPQETPIGVSQKSSLKSFDGPPVTFFKMTVRIYLLKKIVVNEIIEVCLNNA